MYILNWPIIKTYAIIAGILLLAFLGIDTFLGIAGRQSEGLITHYTYMFNIFTENLAYILAFILFVLFLFFTLRLLYVRTAYLFSKTTSEEELLSEMMNLYLTNDYVKMHQLLLYMETTMKERPTHPLYQTFTSLRRFQQLDVQKESLSSNDILSVIEDLTKANTIRYSSLVTAHLAFSFSHLGKVEEDLYRKGLYHWLSAALFRLADPISFQHYAETEEKIYSYYLDYFQDNGDIENALPSTSVKPKWQEILSFVQLQFAS
jgi:hypothetical protein